jgi:hypothetical protein
MIINIAILVLFVLGPLLLWWARQLSWKDNYACYPVGIAAIICGFVGIGLFIWQTFHYLFMVCK